MTTHFDLHASKLAPPPDLATHFQECAAMDANLTLAPGERLVITDDILNGGIVDFAAMSMAAIVARDSMVARAAVLPLSIAASRVDPRQRGKYEKLFALIEDTAFDPAVRETAESLIHTRFRETQIRDLVAELGGVIQPARKRYRAFLDVINLLVAKKVSAPLFLDEFTEFTRAVAGKLDFGIYSLCLDRMFSSERIPLAVKTMLFGEVLKYPPRVRKELVTNLMSSATADVELVRHARREMAGVMTREQLTEITLFTTLKLAWQAQKSAPRRSAA